MPNFKPVRFGKYLILDKIATGGMAELYLAKITSVEGFEKLVAIKKILPNLSSDKNLVDMFIDEAKLAALLTHQNIVQIHDLGSMEGAYFIAMEFLHGKDLRTITKKAQDKNLPLPQEYAVHITCRICSGLDYSHNLKDFQGNPLKLIHRDISPQNILVTYEGEIKIVDFGIAKAAKKSSDTEEGLIKGKVAYMSPEQAAGKTIDHRSDIFSTGILLYEMVTGKRMFEGSDLNILDRVRKADFEPAEKVVTDLPPELVEVLKRALAKAPSRRYKSCAAMLTDLEDCLSSFSVRPSAEGLSQYMKGLFAEEIAAELAALQQVEESVLPSKEEVTSESITKTMLAPQDTNGTAAEKPLEVRKKQRLWLGAWAVAMAIIATALALFFQDKYVRNPSQMKPKATVQSTKASIPSKTKTPPSSVKKPTPPTPTKLQLALRALKNEQYAKAAALFEEALASQPEDKAKIVGPYAQALVGGAKSIAATNPRKAKALLEKAIDLNPQNARAHFYLGKIYTAKKNYPEAIKAYGKVTDLAPAFPDAFFNLGFIYYRTGDYAKAEEMFQKVVALSPSYLDEAYFNLAMVQNLQGKSKESIRNLERALEVNPKNDRAKKYLLRLKRTSQNRDEKNRLENEKFGTDRTSFALVLWWLCDDGQICAAGTRKPSFLG